MTYKLKVYGISLNFTFLILQVVFVLPLKFFTQDLFNLSIRIGIIKPYVN